VFAGPVVAVAPLWDGQPSGWPASAAAGAAADGAAPVGEGPWVRAARCGPTDPAIAEASRECFAVAREALDRMAAPAAITATVDAFIEEYVSKDRCPADDLLEEAK
jgi:glutamate--cysteine ligase